MFKQGTGTAEHYLVISYKPQNTPHQVYERTSPYLPQYRVIFDNFKLFNEYLRRHCTPQSLAALQGRQMHGKYTVTNKHKVKLSGEGKVRLK